MLDFIVSPPGQTGCSGEFPVRASIPDQATYCFFARYFRDARLPDGPELYLDFYGATDLCGYALVRLRQVLVEAVGDLATRPRRFRVLTGWRGAVATAEAELWAELDREQTIEIAREIVAAVELAEATTGHLEALGD